MNSSDRRQLNSAIEKLNKEYGDRFGQKVFKITYIVSIIFAFFALAIYTIVEVKVSNEEFVIDSNKKCIISIITGSKTISYYEVDFEKNIMVKRYDSDLKRIRVRKEKITSNELENLISEVIQDDDNLEFMDEEKKELFDKGIYTYYKVKVMGEKEYYIKQIKQIEKIRNLIGI